jgi:hypothetical protein
MRSLLTFMLRPVLLVYNFEEDEIVRACGMHGRIEKYIQGCGLKAGGPWKTACGWVDKSLQLKGFPKII